MTMFRALLVAACVMPACAGDTKLTDSATAEAAPYAVVASGEWDQANAAAAVLYAHGIDAVVVGSRGATLGVPGPDAPAARALVASRDGLHVFSRDELAAMHLEP